MPLTLTQIAANRATVTFEYAGQPVHIEYAPSLVTETTIAQAIAIQDAITGGMGGKRADEVDTMSEEEGRAVITEFTDAMSQMNAFLCRAILRWDVFEDAEMTTPIALTPERLRDLPIDFRARCFRALQQGVQVGETTGTRRASSRRSHATTTTATAIG